MTTLVQLATQREPDGSRQAVSLLVQVVLVRKALGLGWVLLFSHVIH